MLTLIIGEKGSGKTKKIIDMANDYVNEAQGTIIFINKDERIMYDLTHEIRFVCLDDFDEFQDVDSYISFIYGMLSLDHDIEYIFMDSILKYGKIEVSDLPEFLDKLNTIGQNKDIQFITSLSTSAEAIPAEVEKYKTIEME